MSKYILTIGDDIITGGEKQELLPKYNDQLKVYKESNKRWSLEPCIWKLDKSPTKNNK